MTRVRALSAWSFAVLVVAAAAMAARSAGGAGAFLRVDQLAIGPAAALSAAGAVLPFGYAFVAGMVAAVNPCGFALLPAYLGLYLGSPAESPSPAIRLGRALSVAGTLSAVFVLVFGAAGVVLTVAGTALGSALPVVGLLVGLLLAAAGAHRLGGGRILFTLGDRAAGRLGSAVRAPGHLGYAAYGLAYAAASMGCALPVFFTVVGFATAGHDRLSSAGQLALYGLGMGLVVTALTVAAALVKGTAAAAGVRGATWQVVERAGGLLLVLTGAYVSAYWLALGF